MTNIPNLDSKPEDLVPDNLVNKIKTITFKSHKPERVYRKHVLGVHKQDFSLLNESLVEVTSEKDAEKLDEFMDYLYALIKYCCSSCTTCGNKTFSLRDTCVGNNNEIKISCPVCKCTVGTDNTTESRNYIKWFKGEILKNDPDIDLSNGFPKLLRYKYMGKCYECAGIPVHDKEMIQFFRFDR